LFYVHPFTFTFTLFVVYVRCLRSFLVCCYVPVYTFSSTFGYICAFTFSFVAFTFFVVFCLLRTFVRFVLLLLRFTLLCSDLLRCLVYVVALFVYVPFTFVVVGAVVSFVHVFTFVLICCVTFVVVVVGVVRCSLFVTFSRSTLLHHSFGSLLYVCLRCLLLFRFWIGSFTIGCSVACVYWVGLRFRLFVGLRLVVRLRLRSWFVCVAVACHFHFHLVRAPLRFSRRILRTVGRVARAAVPPRSLSLAPAASRLCYAGSIWTLVLRLPSFSRVTSFTAFTVLTLFGCLHMRYVARAAHVYVHLVCVAPALFTLPLFTLVRLVHVTVRCLVVTISLFVLRYRRSPGCHVIYVHGFV